MPPSTRALLGPQEEGDVDIIRPGCVRTKPEARGFQWLISCEKHRAATRGYVDWAGDYVRNFYDNDMATADGLCSNVVVCERLDKGLRAAANR